MQSLLNGIEIGLGDLLGGAGILHLLGAQMRRLHVSPNLSSRQSFSESPFQPLEAINEVRHRLTLHQFFPD